MKKLKRVIIITAALGILSQAAWIAIYLHVHSVADRYIVNDIGDIPPAHTCLVLGAAVYGDGRVSDVLYDRMMKALELYRAGKVRKFLLSGDHSTFYYNEVRQMRDFMLRRGVPREALFLDHAGINTYSSMVRARKVFLADDCIVVTQRFHLPRALYIARKAGLRARGFPADRRRYLHRHRYAVREYFACAKAFLDVMIDRETRFPGKIIPITGSGAPGRDAR
ncbi:MAG TPA: ElyC/SanA/YdcF family protein [Spirochaetota bacterium]|nr:ElyC/SanA/YdcF family protein [Spirochaetota bacterium]HPC42380.1 ElyC/SanA/YdcF family protein [Spirochaetota bacterium]HPL16402.1 ElyC/SanA/YdcF family protein [Spirochaetota bacterium]HQF08031.1 ElyC/SanA/YdcF family protein [Spirochaetota bacterium]HQH96591.1 ElyC/SanA/YdcF family protein [Spirochaetota bacterium]